MQGIQHAGVRPLLALTGEGLEAPPCFESAIGYAGKRRYVSFHITARSSSVVEDGESVRAGHYIPLAVWSRHLSVWPALSGVGVNWLGHGALSDPEHHIILDRSTRRLYAGLGADVRGVLREALQTETFQHSPSRNGAGEQGQAAHTGFDRGTLAALLVWLDAQPLPCPSCRTTHVAGDFEVGESRHPPEEDRQQGDVNPTCPSCGEPFYGRPLLVLLASLVPRDEATPFPGGITGDTSVS